MQPPIKTSLILGTSNALEKHWVAFQLDVAALRPVLSPLYLSAFESRRKHTLLAEDGIPEEIGAYAIMRPTQGEHNGVPDVLSVLHPTYTSRLESVTAAGIILLMLDTAVQQFGRVIQQKTCEEMRAGELIQSPVGSDSVFASTLLWAGANNLRHVDEWKASADGFLAPRNSRDRKLRTRQLRSMEPIAIAIGCAMPITDLCSTEILQALSTHSGTTTGSYGQLEWHVLRIGRDLIRRAGLQEAPIGVTVLKTGPTSDVPPQQRHMSDGIARAASSVHSALPNVKPLK